MPKNVVVFSCLIISPSDVTEAREAAVRAIENWNAQVGVGLNVRIDANRWESHARPEMGAPGQDIINRQLVEKCDFGVAIFWSRLGSPTEKYPSGSVEEIEQLLLQGSKVMVYFSSQPIPQEALGDGQYARLQELKKRYLKNGLVGTFDTPSGLREQVQLHLTNLVNELLSKESGEAQSIPTGGGPRGSIPSVSSASSQSTIVGPSAIAASNLDAAVSDFTPKNVVVPTVKAVDIAIITILPEEYAAVKRRLKNARRDPGTAEQPNQYAWLLGEIERNEGGTYRVVLAMTVHAGNVSGSLGIARTVARWNPRYVLLVGIAGGLPRDKLALGDAVISMQICSYEYGKIEHNAFNPRPNFVYQVDTGLLRNAASLLFDKEWHTSLIDRPVDAGEGPKVLLGMVGSGEKVIDDRGAEFFAAVEKAFPKLQAVEMEGAGAAAAIEELQAESRTIGFLMIRGISDMPPSVTPNETSNKASIDSDRDKWKIFAAEVAAAFTTYFVANAWPVPPSEILTPVDGILTPANGANRDGHASAKVDLVQSELKKTAKLAPDEWAQCFCAYDVAYLGLGIRHTIDLLFGEIGFMVGENHLQLDQILYIIEASTQSLLPSNRHNDLVALSRRLIDAATNAREGNKEWSAVDGLADNVETIVRTLEYTLGGKSLIAYDLGVAMRQWEVDADEVDATVKPELRSRLLEQANNLGLSSDTNLEIKKLINKFNRDKGLSRSSIPWRAYNLVRRAIRAMRFTQSAKMG